MKLTIERAALLKALGHVQSVVERRNTIPILSNVLLSADGEAVSFSATDLDMEILDEATARVEGSGQITAPAHTLYEIVRKLPDGADVALTYSGDDPRLTVQAGRSRFNLPVLPAGDFPVMSSDGLSGRISIDTGDLMDHGSKPEDKFADSISDLKIPYVYIRGNHDSKGSQRAVARQKNAIVLDDQTREVGGLRLYGVGDPRFTPDKSTRDDFVGADQVRAEGQVLADRLRRSGTTPDVVLTHDPAEGEAFSGLTPLILSGHLHARETKLLPTGTRLFVQGSTGGAGLRGLEHEQPTPIELSVLYFNRASHRLQGWDDLQLGGLGLTSAKIERHLEPDPNRAIRPQPPATAPPASPTSPFPSRFPSDWPSRSPSPTSSPTSSPSPTRETRCRNASAGR